MTAPVRVEPSFDRNGRAATPAHSGPLVPNRALGTPRSAVRTRPSLTARAVRALIPGGRVTAARAAMFSRYSYDRWDF